MSNLLEEQKNKIFESLDFLLEVVTRSTSERMVNKAIDNKKVLVLHYKGEMDEKNQVRVVEPFVYGKHKDSGNDVLRAWLRRGYSYSYDKSGKVIYDNLAKKPGWRLYRLDRFDSISYSNSTFDGNRPKYNPNDTHMGIIYNKI